MLQKKICELCNKKEAELDCSHTFGHWLYVCKECYLKYLTFMTFIKTSSIKEEQDNESRRK